MLTKYEEKGYYSLIDLYSQFVNDEGMMIKEYTNDGVHLSEKGYEHWGSFEKTIIKKLNDYEK
ncbi:MAG: hypothetical protein PF486_07990 [Prolixibacteraceae bacterium]|jgi:lysophospholipase L1-like esterase|nr:hypothetical protein [Prolixibacteraceae bacterium]